MSIAKLDNNINGYGDLQSQGSSGSQTTGRLLDTLGDRVNQALAKDSQSGGSGVQAADKVNNQDILKGISELSIKHYQGPLAGMNMSYVV